jgi:hypothetical protein
MPACMFTFVGLSDDQRYYINELDDWGSIPDLVIIILHCFCQSSSDGFSLCFQIALRSSTAVIGTMAVTRVLRPRARSVSSTQATTTPPVLTGSITTSAHVSHACNN